ncbi:MAG: hypothetical protein AVDCRST_MAG56-7846 [uncultured Cytophagales bacterium]|uniref:DUF983 domain-containing protein n=1 Tax=uncultured Cytophagales bacterium TaxID=158755 RepID=A0A6J4LQS0_9SPHI|nr:MAG: hypothetical protein AVDCRST_MAG56-7846 [uncultured Cytophagales bacterium]
MIPTKGNKLYSVLHGVCPRCQEGKVFRFAPYRNLDFSKMNEQCSVCSLVFEPEPDFYQGAMYVSYGLSTGLFLAVGVVLLFYLELGYGITFAAILLLGIGLLPVLFRVSRLVWLNLFFNYRPLNR